MNSQSVDWKTPLPAVVGSGTGFSRLMAPFLSGMICRADTKDLMLLRIVLEKHAPGE